MNTSDAFTPIGYLWLIPLMPLLGAFVSGAFGAHLQRRFGRAPIVAVSVLLPWVSCALAIAALARLSGLEEGARLLVDRPWTWFVVGAAHVDFAFAMDPLSGMMTFIVTFVGSLIHVYSVGYMRDDPSFWRFFSHLNLFLFSMLVLVLGDNLLLMFVGWEGVGLCSYLLIGFWYSDLANARAGMKAFVVNRVGDFGFLVGFFILYWSLGGAWSETGYHTTGGFSVTFRELPALVAAVAEEGRTLWGVPALTLVGLFFFVGATGKSAQIPLYVWLPDAMAGPTPVSALIHAATMVTAGVYMVARMNFLYVHSAAAMTAVAVTGVATAVVAATIGCFQNDIKKVLAYSTVSQLGFMFIGVGVGAFWAGTYHLLTHAFFKACLFLGAGSVILAMHHEQDMRKMGGLGRVMPLTRWTYWLACVAISGFPIAAGFYSKDEILWQAFNSDALLVPGWTIWLAGFLAAGMTSFYMWRSYFLTFTGPTAKLEAHGHGAHGDDAHGHAEPREQAPVITWVLAILAALAVAASLLGLPVLWTGHAPWLEHWLAPVFEAAEELPRVYAHGEGHGAEWALMLASVGLATAGMLLALWLYRGRSNPLPARLLARYADVHRVVYNKYYVDELYAATAVRGFMATSRGADWVDRHVVDRAVTICGEVTRAFASIDGFIDAHLVDGAVNLVGRSITASGAQLRKLQTGRVPAYLAGMLVGLAVLIILTRFVVDLWT